MSSCARYRIIGDRRMFCKEIASPPTVRSYFAIPYLLPTLIIGKTSTIFPGNLTSCLQLYSFNSAYMNSSVLRNPCYGCTNHFYTYTTKCCWFLTFHISGVDCIHSNSYNNILNCKIWQAVNHWLVNVACDIIERQA